MSVGYGCVVALVLHTRVGYTGNVALLVYTIQFPTQHTGSYHYILYDSYTIVIVSNRFMDCRISLNNNECVSRLLMQCVHVLSIGSEYETHMSCHKTCNYLTL